MNNNENLNNVFGKYFSDFNFESSGEYSDGNNGHYDHSDHSDDSSDD